MASKRRPMYVIAVHRAEDDGPSPSFIPGYGAYNYERKMRALPTNEGASRPRPGASPRQKAPRNRRYSRRYPGDRFTGNGRRPNQFN